jgi:hypothetical protein
MDSRRYRQIIIGSIASLVGLVVAVWILNPLGEDAALPGPLEGVFPLPGDTVVLQTAIEVDLPIGYSVSLEVDGISIPQDEVGVTPAVGRYVWQPGPAKLFEAWEAGEHTVTIRWDRVSGGGPDPGEFTWSFRVV